MAGKMKRCPKCLLELPARKFYRTPKGLSGYCKSCTAEISSARYRSHAGPRLQLKTASAKLPRPAPARMTRAAAFRWLWST